MKLSPDFEKFLSFIPEILSRDESFLKDLESCTRGVTIRKGDFLIRTGELCQDAYFINKGLFINQYIFFNFLYYLFLNKIFCVYLSLFRA